MGNRCPSKNQEVCLLLDVFSTDRSPPVNVNKNTRTAKGEQLDKTLSNHTKLQFGFIC